MNELIKSVKTLPDYLKQKELRIRRVGEFVDSKVIPVISNLGASGFHLEIGCGHGHWLTSYALSQPGRVFVGIDLQSRRIKKSESKKDNLGLENVFFLKAEASEFLCSLRTNVKILSTTLMFPDPWPKKRHFKNRIIQREFLVSLAKVSAENSAIFFKTDHLDYYSWTQELLLGSSLWKISKKPWPHKSSSFFENLFQSSYTCSAIKS